MTVLAVLRGTQGGGTKIHGPSRFSPAWLSVRFSGDGCSRSAIALGLQPTPYPPGLSLLLSLGGEVRSETWWPRGGGPLASGPRSAGGLARPTAQVCFLLALISVFFIAKSGMLACGF